MKDWFFNAKTTTDSFCADLQNAGGPEGCQVEKYVDATSEGYRVTGATCSADAGDGDLGEAPDDDKAGETPQQCSSQQKAFKVENGKGKCVEPLTPSDCRSNETFGELNGKNVCVKNAGGGTNPGGGESSTPGGETGGNTGNTGDGDKDGEGSGDGDKGDGSGSTGGNKGDGNGTGNGDASGGASEGQGDESNCPSWAKGLCDALNWNPGEPDLGGTDGLPGKNTESIGIGNFDTSDRFLGGGYCPQPRIFELDMVITRSRFELSYQPFCDFAGFLRYLVITVALLVAARIVFTNKS